GVEGAAVGPGGAGAGAWRCACTGTLARGLGQAPHEHAVPDVPGNPRQLPRAVGGAGGELGDGIGHAVAPQQGGKAIPQPRQAATVPTARVVTVVEEGRAASRHLDYGEDL